MTFPKAPPAAALASDSPDDVEARFYEALQKGDIEAVMALWADEDDVVCVHPGGPRLVGLGAIRAAFEALFARGPVAVRPEQVRRLQQIGCSLHHLVERIEARAGSAAVQTAWVVATNFYVKTAQGWRLAAHHASPGSAADLAHLGAGDAPSTLH